jgi:hypothetical protein
MQHPPPVERHRDAAEAIGGAGATMWGLIGVVTCPGIWGALDQLLGVPMTKVKRYKIESHGMDGQDAVNIDDWRDSFPTEDSHAFILATDYDILASALRECERVRDEWCQAFTEQREDAEALVRRCAELEKRR